VAKLRDLIGALKEDLRVREFPAFKPVSRESLNTRQSRSGESFTATMTTSQGTSREYSAEQADADAAEALAELARTETTIDQKRSYLEADIERFREEKHHFTTALKEECQKRGEWFVPFLEKFSENVGNMLTDGGIGGTLPKQSGSYGEPNCGITQYNEREMVQPARHVLTVSDSLIAPTHFTGKLGDVDAESWLELFERYCEHRRLGNEEKRTLFPLMLRQGALDWVSTLGGEAFATYETLKEAFKANYFGPPELRWQATGSLWNESQRPAERVEDFVTRIRKGARRLRLEPQAITDVVLHGLRPAIRMHVLQRGAENLDQLVRYAKIAEAVAPSMGETSSAALMDIMRASAVANERQAAELKTLTGKVAALIGGRVAGINAISGSGAAPAPMGTQRVTFNRQPYRQDFRASPQQQQRTNYSRMANNRQPNQGARPFVSRQPNTASGSVCDRCALSHPPGSCRAEGEICRACGRVGHYARACRQRSHVQQ